MPTQRSTLDAILSQSGDPEVRHRALFTFCVRQWTDEDDLEAAVQQIEAQMPDFKLGLCPHPWQVRLLSGEDEPRMRLCRSLNDMLKNIRFGKKKPTNAHIIALTCSPHVAGLEKLSIGSGTFGAKAAVAVASSPNLGQLRELAFRYFKPGRAGMKALGASQTLSAFTTLNMFGNTVDDAAMGAFCAEDGLCTLETLALTHCQVGPDGAAALAGASRLTALHTLDMAFNPLGPAGIAALAAGAFPALRTLDLVRTRADDAAIAHLAAAPWIGNLHAFSVSLDAPGPGLTALVRSARSLKQLSISGLSEEAADALKAEMAPGAELTT
ncbi:MAG: hypothetical protein ACI8RZ_005784 [Myxococcota bacterium]|jgi:hypothetical protein